MLYYNHANKRCREITTGDRTEVTMLIETEQSSYRVDNGDVYKLNPSTGRFDERVGQVMPATLRHLSIGKTFEFMQSGKDATQRIVNTNGGIVTNITQ